MSNNENKKSAGQWTQRLFKQATPAKAGVHGKAYFGHRFHVNQAALGQIPFSALFSDAGKSQLSNLSDPIEVNKVFWQEPEFLDEKPVSAEIYPLDGRNSTLATDSASCHNKPALSNQFTILSCYDETLDTKTFRLGSPNGQVCAYLPGQYITINIVIAGQEYKRSYSIASSPSRPGSIEITVKRDPNGGVVSNWLNDQLKVGDSIQVKGPFGQFTCAKTLPPKPLFMAAGSGIVPIMSMLRWLTDTNSQVDVVLVLSFRTVYDIIYKDELQLLAARYPNVKLHITLTQEPQDYSQWHGLRGRISEQMLAGCVPDVAERVVYLCGPDAFMADCKHYLQALNLPQEHTFTESFTVNSPVAEGQATDVSKAAANQKPNVLPLRKQTGSYQVSFAKSGKAVVADGAVTLLELAEQSSIALAHECRAGTCGECMAKCLEGQVEMTEQAEIADFDRKRGWVYACCAYPTSDVVLDI